ncbi:hypothetical protein EVAR_44005_1 [Eumeta japonica]|uniref:Uncharacterized protein n=1 Tax=Eumeta variegata TaxID=151549 RepID=A0A4C1XGF8_EUMVA|nr:hypothetical protein EVAR_44005_1 [Eumeta japonica]
MSKSRCGPKPTLGMGLRSEHTNELHRNQGEPYLCGRAAPAAEEASYDVADVAARSSRDKSVANPSLIYFRTAPDVGRSPLSSAERKLPDQGFFISPTREPSF